MSCLQDAIRYRIVSLTTMLVLVGLVAPFALADDPGFPTFNLRRSDHRETATTDPARVLNDSSSQQTRLPIRPTNRSVSHGSISRREDVPESAQAIPLRRNESNSSTESSSGRQKSDAGSFGSIIWALVFVTVLMVIVLNLLKRFGGTAAQSKADELFEVLAHKPLSRQQSIHVVRCGMRVLVLGESPNSLNTLAEITDPTEIECLVGMCRTEGKDSNAITRFKQSLWNYVGSAKPRNQQTTSTRTVVKQQKTPTSVSEAARG